MESDHQNAVTSQAVERYLLGDLDPALRERFEDHFFGCPTCAEALRTGAVLEESARALFRADPRLTATDRRQSSGLADSGAATQGSQIAPSTATAERRKGWMPRPGLRTLAPWAVAVFFAVLSLKQYRDLTAPRAEAATPLILRADSRGAAVSASAPSGAALSLNIDVPSDGPYHWTLRQSEAASSKDFLSGLAQSRRGLLTIIVSAGTLPPGVYMVALSPQHSGTTPLPDRLYYFELTRVQRN